MSFINKYLSKVDKNVRIYFMFSLFDLMVGFVGTFVYAGLTVSYGPTWVRNQYIGMWLMVHIFLTSIQSIYTELKQIKIKNIIFYIDLIYYLATILISLLMSIFFGIAGKIDATIWSVYICAVNITNVYILYLKTKTINFENVLQEDNKLFMDKNDQMKINRKKIEFIIATLIIVIKIFGLIVLCLILAGSIVVGAGTIK